MSSLVLPSSSSSLSPSITLNLLDTLSSTMEPLNSSLNSWRRISKISSLPSRRRRRMERTEARRMQPKDSRMISSLLYRWKREMLESLQTVSRYLDELRSLSTSKRRLALTLHQADIAPPPSTSTFIGLVAARMVQSSAAAIRRDAMAARKDAAEGRESNAALPLLFPNSDRQ